MRPSSKNVLFLHLELLESKKRVEIISKAVENKEIADFIRYSIKIGDTIEIGTMLEELDHSVL